MQDSYPKQFGNYLLTRRIAVGGMAEVFKAKLQGAMGFQKTLALKRILPEYSQDEEFVQMFVDEARISSNLHHKNIVQIFDFGEVDHQYYLAMEFIDGCNLKNLFFRLLKQNRHLPREMIYYIILKTASALDYAHKVKMEGQIQSLQLVHRDVSPQNILISKQGDVKITDFGIAKATIKLSQTQPGKIQGKYSYMSPEQALGKSINYQSDIFSLGIVFYELLTAKKVYGSSETIKRYTEATKANIPQIGTILPDLPAQVEALITRMVSRNAEDRPKDCTEIIDTLTEFLTSTSDEVLSSQLGELVIEMFPEDTALATPERLPGLSTRDHVRLELKSDSKNAKVRTDAAPSAIGKWIFRLVALAAVVGLVIFVPKFSTYFPSLKKTVQKNKPKITLENSDQTTPSVDEEKQNVLQDLELQMSQIDDEMRIVQSELHKTNEAAKPKKSEEDDEGLISAPKAVSLPPRGCPSDMVIIEAGGFMMGSNDPERNELVETTASQQQIQKFCIDKYEYPNQKNTPPTRNVSWVEANQLCEKSEKRLCTEMEWERSCKGPWSMIMNQQYPYGTSWKENACNIKNFNSLTDDKAGNIADSGDYPECTTVEGVFDLAGNAQEWTSSGGQLQSQNKIIKGGSFMTPKFQSRCSYLREELPTFRQDDIGFRCCKNY